MSYKSFLWLMVGIILFPFSFNVNYTYAETSKESIKGQLEHIAKFTNSERHRMRCNHGVIAGNVFTGASGWASNSSLNAARNTAFKNCNKHGGGCEELFTITIHNYTPNAVKILLFCPWETDFSESNALFSWEWSPGCDRNLGIGGGHLFISKEFYLKIISTGGGGAYWGEKKIANFGFSQRDYRDGQNLSIKLIEK